MKYFASDIDGTLVKHNGSDTKRSILVEDQIALQEWIKSHYLIISTGRNQLSCFKGLDYYGNIKLPNTFYMTSNGAEIYDENRKCLYRQTLESSVLRDVASVLKGLKTQYDIEISIFTGDEMIMIEDCESLVQYTSIVNIGLTVLSQSIEETSICCQMVKDAIAEKAEVHENNWYVDIVPKGISKASTLQYLISNVMHDEDAYLIAIGDGANDICMFEVANRSYTFNFASKTVQKAASQCVNHVYEAIALELQKGELIQ